MGSKSPQVRLKMHKHFMFTAYEPTLITLMALLYTCHLQLVLLIESSHWSLHNISNPVTVLLDNVLKKLPKLGILNLTWSSEHYGLEYVKATIRKCRFNIMDISTIGSQVYEPLALYYIQNRKELRRKIMTLYPSYIEKILCKSLVKMMTVSKKGLIEYIVLKAQKI